MIPIALNINVSILLTAQSNIFADFHFWETKENDAIASGSKQKDAFTCDGPS